MSLLYGGVVLWGALLLVLGAKNSHEKMQEFRNLIIKVCTTVFLMVWCIFLLSGISTFLYFNFGGEEIC